MTEPRTDDGYRAWRLIEAVEDADEIDAETIRKALRKLRQALRRKSS